MPTPPSPPARQRFPLDALILEDGTGSPLYRQLEDQIRTAILENRLPPGERLPSTRRLAQDLGVARNTAISAYRQLAVEGYLVTSSGSGTRVAQDLPESLLRMPGRAARQGTLSGSFQWPASARRMQAIASWIEADVSRPMRPFHSLPPASDAFPRKLWAQLTIRRARRMSRDLLERADPRGYAPLREAISGYLGSARGVNCDADQVVVTAGIQQAIELAAKLLIEPGDTVCMEDPGYTPARVLFELAGAKVISVPVDGEGLEVAWLEKAVVAAKLVYVTPSSQFPLGMTMSLPRRLALIEWTRRAGAVIFEDDYNGEYRYAGRPLPALHGLAPPGQVIYAGSFSKLLFPSLRIGYLVAPPEGVDQFATARWLIDRHSPPLEQAVLSDFIEGGHFARHVRRMRTLYAERQGALVEAAARDLEGILDVPAADAGMHLIGWRAGALSEAALLRAADSAGIELTPTSVFATESATRDGVLLGYAPFSPREIRRATKALARACRA